MTRRAVTAWTWRSISPPTASTRACRGSETLESKFNSADLNSSIPTQAPRIQASHRSSGGDLMVLQTNTVKQSFLEKFELAERFRFLNELLDQDVFWRSSRRFGNAPSPLAVPGAAADASDEERDARQEELDELQAALQATPLPDKVRTRAERKLETVSTDEPHERGSSGRAHLPRLDH